MTIHQKTIAYIAHGGGPMPLLGDASHAEMVTELQALAGRLAKPSAILVISAHWEEKVPTITAGAHPSLIYDYYGFPAETYELTYPAPGEPKLAQEIYDCLKSSGVDAKLDTQRGWDHGVFVPLMLMYPDASIPVVELSLVAGLDATQHVDLGAALAELDYDNLLVIGSGFSFHNMRAFGAPNTGVVKEQNEAFDVWLQETCSSTQLDEAQRTQRFIEWNQAPGAQFCHPREEHLMPVHICYGMAQKPSDFVVSLQVLGKQASMVGWENV
ncbi:DODA-type extradiol aromatic ring-opening family dioxygenase [Vibrio palustris]|uniref:LigB family dioxygenase n=1 Tax=Vibrio palustris TaxID=1918946 RepID=A0A1R4B5L6_9VIBR|nr:class III extradiol ring-cleavage dioxygenase [Vibrio palustris]SJL84186.1 LigB family dioxygenase [Vibrio palustris]